MSMDTSAACAETPENVKLFNDPKPTQQPERVKVCGGCPVAEPVRGVGCAFKET